MVGMEDLRTPPSEAKQLYHALKLRKVPTVLVKSQKPVMELPTGRAT